MVAVLFLLVALSAPTFEQETEPTVPISPCPSVFRYESVPEKRVVLSSRWYGVINLSTDNTLYALWLDIALDRKANIIGTWIGDVVTKDNINFKIENSTVMIKPGPPTPVRFFVQYSPLEETPKLQAIRVNGREVCNASIPQPTADVENPEEIPELNLSPSPETPRPALSPSKIPLRITSDKPDLFKPGQPSTKDRLDFELVTFRPNPVPVPDDFIEGGLPILILPGRQEQLSSSSSSSVFGGRTSSPIQCGKVADSANPLVVKGTPTAERQWPWQIALYETQVQKVDNKYICGGTLVSHRHIITAAHCVIKKISKQKADENTLTVYLGKHNLRTSVEGVQVKFVKSIIMHPEYSPATYSRDIAILELREQVTYTDWVRPACLWPENQVDLNIIIGKIGSVVGWGEDESGVMAGDLNLVQMPVIDQLTCVRSYGEFFSKFASDYTYCAGYRDGTSVCNGDSGGGMVFNSGGTWYLRGIVSLSVARRIDYRCDPTHYVIFTDVAKLLPWVKQNVYDY